LQAAFESGLYRNVDEEERIEELRAAVAKWTPSAPRRNLKLVMGLVALLGCLAFALYLQLFPH
jgi:hypothetical protein